MLSLDLEGPKTDKVELLDDYIRQRVIVEFREKFW